MPRTRHQNGRVHCTDNKAKWYGEFYVYRIGEDGKERRKHRTVVLGSKSELKKWEAQKKLWEIIDRETSGVIIPENVTFAWFWENRYVPMRTGRLRRSSRKNLRWFVGPHLLKEFGDVPLEKMERFECQKYLDRLADQGYSESIIHKARTYLKAILDEALEQDFIHKNPARLLEKPQVQRRSRRFLSEEEVQKLLVSLQGRDRLMLKVFLVCGLRPGELFGLRWNDWTPGVLRVDESVWEGEFGKTKTDTSTGFVVVPLSIEVELGQWKRESGEPHDEALIFPSRKGTPIARRNWLDRNLAPIAKAAGVEGVNYQALRRTFATTMQKCGSVKDAQAQLRHASPNLTAAVYMQQIPESVRQAVELLDKRLCPPEPSGRVQ